MSLRWSLRRLRRRLRPIRPLLAAAVGTLATILSTVYDRVPSGLQAAALLTMGVFTATAVLLVESPPEARYGQPIEGMRAVVAAKAAAKGGTHGTRSARRRWRVSRLLWWRTSKVVPALPPRDELFSGRERELAELQRRHDVQRQARVAVGRRDRHRLRQARHRQETGPVVLMLYGKPGVGKTALADALARRLAGQYPHGQVFVNLGTGGTARTPNEILKDFLLALGWSEDEMPETTVGRALVFRSLTSKKKILFILDAARHADQVRDVMPSDPAAAVIITSRRDLTWSDPPPSASYALDIPDEDDALTIFRAVSDTEESTRPECAAEIVHLCGRLPLAIRAAAERVSNDGTDICNIAGLLRAPRSRLTWLDQPGRPLRAHIQTEYGRLLPQEQRALALLALVPSSTFVPWVLQPLMGVVAAQAEALVDRLAAAQLLDDLGTDEASGVARYGFHPLIRLFAMERAAALSADERDRAQTDLVLAYREVVCAVLGVLDPEFPQRPEPKWLPADSTLPKRIADHPETWVRAEYPNLLPVMALAAREGAGGTALCWRTGAWLNGCVSAEVSPEDTLEAYARAVRAAEQDGNDLGLVDVLLAKGTYLVAIERYRQARECLEKANELTGRLFARATQRPARRVAQQRNTVATRKMGEAYLQAAAYRYALDELEKAFAMAEAIDDEPEMRLIQILVADAHHVDTPEATYDQLLDPELPDATRYRVFLSLAEAARRRGEWRSADDYLAQALRFVDGDLRRMATIQYRLGRLFLDEHAAAETAGAADPDVAAKAVRRAATAAVAFRRMRNDIGAVRAHTLLARAMLAIGHPVGAEHMAHTAAAEFAALLDSGEQAAVLLPIAARLRRAEGELRLQAGDSPAARHLMMESATALGEHQDWTVLDKVLHSLERLDKPTVPRPRSGGDGGAATAPWSGRPSLPGLSASGPSLFSNATAEGLAARLGGLVADRVQDEIREALVPATPVAFRGALGAGLSAGSGATQARAASPGAMPPNATPLWRVPVARPCELTVIVVTGGPAFAGHDRDLPTLLGASVWLPFAVAAGTNAPDVDLTVMVDAPFVDVLDSRLVARCPTEGGLVRLHTTLRVAQPGSYDLRVAVLSAGRLVQTLPIELEAGEGEVSDGQPDGPGARRNDLYNVQ